MLVRSASLCPIEVLRVARTREKIRLREQDLLRVRRLLVLLDAALEKQKSVSNAEIEKELGLSRDELRDFLKQWPEPVRLLRQWQSVISHKREKYYESLYGARPVGKSVSQKAVQFPIWITPRERYQEAVTTLRQNGQRVTRVTIAHAAGRAPGSVSAYLRRNPHMRALWKVRPESPARLH